MSDLKRNLIKELKIFFGDKVSGFCSKPGIGFPPAIDIDFIIYSYFQVTVAVERDSAFFSIRENELSIPITKTELNSPNVVTESRHISVECLEILDNEVRLRIPDKYLKAKGWG